MTYEAEFFVDLVVGGLDRAAGVHLDALRRAGVVAALAVGQQVVLGQDGVAPRGGRRTG